MGREREVQEGRKGGIEERWLGDSKKERRKRNTEVERGGRNCRVNGRRKERERERERERETNTRIWGKKDEWGESDERMVT